MVRHRWCHPQSIAGDENLKRYVGNGVSNLLDPSGLWENQNPSTPAYMQGYSSWLLAITRISMHGSNLGMMNSISQSFMREVSTLRLMVQHPIATISGYWEGTVDGLAMVGNAATFHQIDALNSYVNNSIEQNGGVYGTANVFAHIGAIAAEGAVLVYAWAALGGQPTESG